MQLEILLESYYFFLLISSDKNFTHFWFLSHEIPPYRYKALGKSNI